MAEVVISVLEKLAAVLLEKVQEVQALRGQIEQMQQELLLIQALLKDADSKRDKKELVTVWLNQVREIANTIATVIDTFQQKIEENRAQSSNFFRKITAKIKADVKRNYKTYMLDLPRELEGITQKLNWIYQRGRDLGITDDLRALDDVVDDPEPCDDIDDPEVVGFEDDKVKIIKHLLDGSISRRTVFSIVGTGGLGKTTLAQKVYKSTELEGQFDCRSWLSISQKYSINDLLREILYSVDPRTKNENPPVTDRDLRGKLKSSLKPKRYLIILDDVWDTDLWEQYLKISLPDVGNASRVIITTRSIDVAKAADCNTEPYKLRYLSEAEGLALLFRNAFQKPVQPDDYPHLLEVAKRLTKQCGGLPLALVVLGGILSRKDRNYAAWNTLDETMDWHDKDGNKCLKVVARSYEELPDNLKQCFLYFASFPEDYKISGEHVISMWMAEGFIPEHGAGTMKDRAQKFLQELVQRCLIQVTKNFWNGYCKYCTIHDLLRDLAIQKAKEENFFTVFSKAEADINQLATIKPHRVALQFCTLTKDGVSSENTSSLLCFGFGKLSKNDCGFGLLNYSAFRLLRVLSLERVDMTNFAQRLWLKGLKHLKYLGFRNCHIREDIFQNVSLYNLETIDLEGSSVDSQHIDLGDVVIPTLRHLYGSRISYVSLKWDQHTNLQTVKNVMIDQKKIVELKIVELGCCINLRTLVFGYYQSHEDQKAQKVWENLKGVLIRTEQIVSLGIILTPYNEVPFGGTRGLPCHGKIQKLHLEGKWPRAICVPSVEMFPTNLTKLVLRYSNLEEDPMPILERLQSLRILHLEYDSYVGTELSCSTEGFPNLEKLKLSCLKNLCHWDIKDGAMPNLRHLEISYCEQLHTLPELQKVQTLQELLVIDPSDELRESMQGNDLHKFEHIPSVHTR
ncbi:disease resistance protein RPP13-like [Carex rostrata]